MSDIIVDSLAERFRQSALRAEQYTDYNQLKNTPEFIHLQEVIQSEHPNSENREDFSKHRQMVKGAFFDLKSKISRVVGEEVGKIHAVQQEVQNRVRALEKASKNDKGRETQLALVYARSYEKSYMFSMNERPFVTEEIFARLENYQSDIIQNAIDHESRHFQGVAMQNALAAQELNAVAEMEERKLEDRQQHEIDAQQVLFERDEAQRRNQREHEAAEAAKQREHEERIAKIELMKLEEVRKTTEAQERAAKEARAAATLAKAHESEQFAAILRGLKDGES